MSPSQQFKRSDGSFLQEHERNAVPVFSDGSHRHDPNVVRD